MIRAPWKTSASILLATSKQAVLKCAKQRALFKKDSTPESVCVLLEKRNSKTFKEAHVFPGGLVNSCDFSTHWLKVFKAREPMLSSLIQSGSTPMIYESKTEGLPPQLGLRICAIRELFEETGILLAQKSNTDTFPLHPDHTREWQTKVQGDPNCFIQLFQSEDMYPAVWSLHDWWSWLTPTDMPYRFDTIFYICCMQQLPELLMAESQEVAHLEWMSPETALNEHKNGNIILHIPQIYELARLSSFKSLNELESFASNRSTKGCKTWFPVIVQDTTCQRRHLSLLPGDGCYPADPDFLGERDHLRTPLSVQADNKQRNRIVYSDSMGIRLECNVEPECGHVKPDLTIWSQQ